MYLKNDFDSNLIIVYFTFQIIIRESKMSNHSHPGDENKEEKVNKG